MSEEKNNLIQENENKLDDLFKSPDFKPMPKVDELVEVEVIGISKGEVYLSVEGIFTGLVRGRELIDESGQFSNLKIGDKASATVLEQENEKGVMELSFRSAGHLKAWQYLNELKETGKIVEVKVVDANKGGLIIQLNKIPGFLPVSQLSNEHYPRVEGGNKTKILEKLRKFINQKLKVKIIDVNEKEEKVIVSEKDVFAEQQKELINKFKVGDVVEGKISALVDFGAFVEFKAGEDNNKKLEGLAHISELAWQRIEHPKDVFKVGDEVKAQIINIDENRISLSIKKLLTDPWQEAARKFKIGDVIEGQVLKTDKFGAFVEVSEKIHGLAHISELSDKPIKDPSEIVRVGETYKFKIVSIEPEDHRLGLSLKEINKNEDEKKGRQAEDSKEDSKKQ